MIRLGPARRLHRSWLLARGRVRLRAAGRRASFHVRRERDYLYLLADISERRQLASLLPLLREDDVVYEVGAHIGAWTVFLVQGVPAGRVHAFEPRADLCRELAANLALNRLTNVEIHALAVGRETGEADFGVYPKTGDGRHSLVILEHHGQVERVPVIRLDDVPGLLGAAAATVLKIDCEGAEGWVLEGAARQLADPRLRLIYLELHRGRIERTGHRAGDLLERLEAARFRVVERWNRSEETLLLLARG